MLAEGKHPAQHVIMNDEPDNGVAELKQKKHQKAACSQCLYSVVTYPVANTSDVARCDADAKSIDTYPQRNELMSARFL